MSEQRNDDAQLGACEQALAARLCAQRPVPGAAFRGALGRQLAADDPGYGPRPARLRLLVGGYLGAGGLLVALGALLGAGVI